MDPFDPAIQSAAVYGWKPLITFALFTCVGAFFLGALFTALRRGIKEQAWFSKKIDD